MVGAEPRLRLAAEPAPLRTASAGHRWHRPQWSHLGTGLRVRRSIVGTLVRLDDDPVLLCDCAEGAPHTCG